jgi:hypothetical protein
VQTNGDAFGSVSANTNAENTDNQVASENQLVAASLENGTSDVSGFGRAFHNNDDGHNVFGSFSGGVSGPAVIESVNGFGAFSKNSDRGAAGGSNIKLEAVEDADVPSLASVFLEGSAQGTDLGSMAGANGSADVDGPVRGLGSIAFGAIGGENDDLLSSANGDINISALV